MSCAAVSYAERSVCRFKAFHERYYHPSNARFWFYGDDPAEERLRLLSNFLDNFEERHVDSTVKPQPLFAVSETPAPLCGEWLLIQLFMVSRRQTCSGVVVTDCRPFQSAVL